MGHTNFLESRPPTWCGYLVSVKKIKFYISLFTTSSWDLTNVWGSNTQHLLRPCQPNPLTSTFMVKSYLPNTS